jgi:rhodanese-related sulfurtransferase
LVGCGGKPETTTAGSSGQAAQALAPQPITAQAYQEKFGTSNAKHLLIDVRTPEEFANGHIGGATNIAVDTLAQHLSEIPKDQPVVVYCQSGKRSARAAQILTEAGYSQVYDLGSIVQWQQAGYPLQ